LRVSGESMEPLFSDGEFVLMDVKRRLEEGFVVVADHPHLPDVIVKRIETIDERGVWLLSDNSTSGNDSRRFGAVDPASIHGVVTLIINRPVTALGSFG
jgi:nickel-type superoxide dismutase maturation protease